MKNREPTTPTPRKRPAAERLSVVVPTLGRETVVRTVETLLAAHGGESLEIVVAGKIADPAVKGAIAALADAHPNLRHLEVQFERGDSSLKKNAGAAATGRELLAFVDDDVEVAPDWPEKLAAAFDDPRVGLASGPGLVPDGLNEAGRQAGLALSSGAAGYVSRRYLGDDGGPREADWDDIIGCNAAYRREAFEQIGGFSPDFYPGEEMLASFRTARAGWGLRFVPGARVWHWPRQSLPRFWRQMRCYGATRIRLMRAGVEWHVSTLAPGLWVASLVLLGIAGAWWRLAWWLLGLDAALYAVATFVMAAETIRATRRWGDWRLWPMIWVMHVAYGLGEWGELIVPARDLSDAPVAVAAAPRAPRTNQEGASHGT